jgi:hypothetical protein
MSDKDTVRGLLGTVKAEPDGTYSVWLQTGPHPEASDPWLTVTAETYPADLWPPRSGDTVVVTVPQIIAAKRSTTT